jgi:hypothetical protein
MPSNNNIYKMSNAGGFKSLTRYYDMLAGNTVWNPWEPAGAYESIATITVPSGGAASIQFTGIPQNYAHLQIRGIARSTRSQTGDYIALQLNADTGSNYAYHGLTGNGSTASAFGLATQTFMDVERAAAASATASVFGASVFDILDYANTNKYKTMRNLGGFDNNGSGEIFLTSGLWQNTNAVTTITLKTQGGTSNFAQYSTFALYGIKG